MSLIDAINAMTTEAQIILGLVVGYPIGLLIFGMSDR